MTHWRLKLSMLAVVFLIAAGGWTTATGQTCTHTVTLQDSFGDGWDGLTGYHTLSVYVNGVAVLTNVTMVTGYTIDYTFQASTGDVISTIFTNGGLWDDECSYQIKNNVGGVIATALWPNLSLSNIAGQCTTPPPPPVGCDFEVTMYDSYGDGWNGCYLNIYIDGVLTYTNITIPTGSGPNYFSFSVSHGQEIRVTFVVGSWESECSFEFRQNGALVYSGNGSTGASNALVGTGNCMTDFVALSAMIDYADGYWARRTMPDGNAVRAKFGKIAGANAGEFTAVYNLNAMPVDENDGVSETFTSPNWVNDEVEIEFTDRLTTLPVGPAMVYVRVFGGADPDESNNGIASATHDIKTDVIKGFEDFTLWGSGTLLYDDHFDMGWTVVDLNGGSTWEATSDGGNMALYHPGGQANDWIFAPVTSLAENSSYRLQGIMRTLGSAAKTIELAYGSAPDPGSMTVFATLSGFSNTSYLSFKQLGGMPFDPYFNTVVAQDVYIGIHLLGTSSDPVYIDNLVLDDNPTPPPIIGYGLPGAPLTSYISSPTVPITFNAAYKAPGKINRVYTVANTTDIYGTNGDFLWDVETATPWISVTKQAPAQTLQNWNFSPARPRQFQSFTITVNPFGLAPGNYTGDITFYGILFNDDFPPPSSGLIAINEPFVVPVVLRISNTGSKGGAQSVCQTISSPMTAGNSYAFVDPTTNERIADVLVTSGQIDDMTICVYPKQLPQNITRIRYVQRYWEIKATGAGWMADITFPYADQETGMIIDPFQLRGVRQAVPGGAWENPILGTTSSSDPMNYAVTVSNMNALNSNGIIALAHPYFLGKDITPTPLTTDLGQNYPNPFNPTTTISFSLAADANVRLQVFDLYGREVASVIDTRLEAGHHQASFDARGLPSGNYIYQLDVDGTRMTRTLTIMK
ncbi:MAG: T9SS type A sorting domain-containing protein [Bacteroidota bacterium]|nr:T9SS type A sorting domain-containing protein [Bacteroidota bacterium]